jgi:hypothetical protein
VSGSDAYNDDWWQGCVNTFAEEQKQIRKLELMGVQPIHQEYPYRWPVYDLAGRSVLDLGGGPVSPLLKAVNAGDRAVLDPGQYPGWVWDRYMAAGIVTFRQAAESFVSVGGWDEVWIMNTLRHTVDPEECVGTARLCADHCVRVCEWVNEPLSRDEGQVLTEAQLDAWLGREGRVFGWLQENGTTSELYVGVAAP